MKYIGEGGLDIPAGWHNSTVNIFTAHAPGTPGQSITINRDRLPPGSSFSDYTGEQSKKLARKLRDFKMLEDSTREIDGRAAHFFEFTWQEERSGVIHQLLLSVHGDEGVLNLAASHIGAMESDVRDELARVLLSFRFKS